MEALDLFRSPRTLLWLVVPGALLVWTWGRRGRALVLPYDHARNAAGRWTRVALNLAGSLPPLLLALVIVILAGPQSWGAPRSKRVLTNIQFCVDVSGSMGASFGGGTRYDASMEAINRFLAYREGDAFGLTFFGNNVLHWVPLTSDVSAFRCAPPFLDPRRSARPYWFGGTEIGKALLACREVLAARDEGDRMIILVSDGESFDLEGDRAAEISRRLKEDRIVVYGVHIAEGDVPGPIVDITSWTGGDVFQPGDPAALDAVFKRIDAMQKTKLEKDTPEQVDDFWFLCVAGLSLLGVQLLLAFALRYTPW